MNPSSGPGGDWSVTTPSDLEHRTVGRVPEGDRPAHTGPRELTDPRAMRALAHPVRSLLLELLVREGPLTATAAAALTGQSPSNCSFHLRTLAKYGFVAEAEGGSGRERPWELVTIGSRWEDRSEDEEASAAGSLLSQYVCERNLSRVLDFLDRRDPSDPFHAASTLSDTLQYLTEDEAQELKSELEAVTLRFRERLEDREARPAGSRPVHVVLWAFPLEPTAGESGGEHP